MNTHSNRIGLISIVFATILFSSMEVAIKFLGDAINPIQLNLLRFLFGAFVLLPLALRQLKKARYHITPRDLAVYLLLGFICVVVSMSLFTTSILFLPAYKVAILLSCNTFFAIFLAHFMLKERITKPVALALLVAFIGMCIIVDPLNIGSDAFGVFISLMASLSFALYSVLSKYFTNPSTNGGMVATCFTFIAGSSELVIFIGLSNIPAVANFMKSIGFATWANIPIAKGMTLDNLPLILFIAIGVTGIGFASYFLAIENLNITMASLVFLLKPVLSPIIAFIILGEVITAKNIIALAILTLGSVMLFAGSLANEKRKRRDLYKKELN